MSLNRSFTPLTLLTVVLTQVCIIGTVSCRRSATQPGDGPPSTSASPSTHVSQATDSPRLARDEPQCRALAESAHRAAKEGQYNEAIRLLDQARAFVRERSSGQQDEEFCDEYSREVTRLLDAGPRAADVPALLAFLTELDSKSCFATADGRRTPLFARIRAEMWRFAPAADTKRRMYQIVAYCTGFEQNGGRFPNAEELRRFSDAYEPSRVPDEARLRRLTYDAWGTPFMIVHREGSYPQIVSAGEDRAFSPEQWELSGADLPLDQDAVGEGGRCCRRIWKLEADWKNLLDP